MGEKRALATVGELWPPALDPPPVTSEFSAIPEIRLRMARIVTRSQRQAAYELRTRNREAATEQRRVGREAAQQEIDNSTCGGYG